MTRSRWRLPRGSARTAARSLVLASLGTVVVGVLGGGVAAADTHTGFEGTVTCDGNVTDVVSPTSAAAAAQDVASTHVFVLAVAAFEAPDHFPAGKVQTCDWDNLTTGTQDDGLPFLVRGRP